MKCCMCTVYTYSLVERIIFSSAIFTSHSLFLTSFFLYHCPDDNDNTHIILLITLRLLAVGGCLMDEYNEYVFLM